MNFIQDQTGRVLDRCEASVGYSTCFWANLLNSKVLADKTGRYTALQASARRDYPEKLIRNIRDKNLPLLADSLSSYAKQTAQAESREDWITVNHRTAAFLASWFDIVFAENKIPHPGEKKQIYILKKYARTLPVQWEEHLSALVNPGSQSCSSEIMVAMDKSLKEVFDLTNHGSSK